MGNEWIVFFLIGGRIFDREVVCDRVVAGRHSLAIENPVALGPRNDNPFVLPFLVSDAFRLR